MRLPVIHAGLLALLLAAAQPVRAQSLDRLGILPGGTYSGATGASADGSVVVGFSENSTGRQEAFRWTQAGGMVGLGTLAGGTYSGANGVSADGSVVVGSGDNSAGTLEAFRWTQAGGMVGLGILAGGSLSTATGANADGSVVVGYSDRTGGGEAFRWTQAGGMVGLGKLAGGAYSGANGVSADGSVVVGGSGNSAGSEEAFRWTQAGGMVGLGTLAGGTSSTATGVSADGLVVVGGSNNSTGSQEAFRWTQAAGMVGLGKLAGGTDSTAYGVSADGSVVVGFSVSASGQKAFRWTQTAGMKSVADLLTAGGVDLTGWSLTNAFGTNADGSIIVGQGTQGANTVAFIANLKSSKPGVTTPEDLARSLAPASVPAEQSQQAMTAGLGQSLFAARQATSAAPGLLAEPSRWSAYAIGSTGDRGGDWSLNGTTGLLAGVAPGLRIGAGVIGSQGSSDLYLDGTSRLAALGGALLAAYERPEGLRLYGSAFIAHLAVDTDRHYQNGAGTDGSNSGTDGVGYGMAVRGGWEFPVRSALSVMPYAELQGTEVDLNDYAEKGGAFPAQFSDQTARRLTSRLGAEVTYQAKPALKLRPRLAWGHQLSGNGGSLTATTVGLTQVLNPRQSDSDWAEGAVAAVWQVTEATTLSAALAGRTGQTAEPDVGGTVGISTRL